VLRLLLSPRWLAGHVLAVAACAACLWLGWWQWGRAHHGGGLQSMGYALQWPLFGGFFLFAWVRMVRLELARRSAEGPQAPGTGGPPAADPVRPAWAYQPPVIDDEDGDEELAAYNRHLAALHQQDTERNDREVAG
jgi:hypothetical protein